MLYSLKLMNNITIARIEKYVKKKMSGESSGHDWFHVQRVFNMATLIATKEKKGDLLLIQATSLLHDLGDWKLNTTGNSEEEIISDACQKLKISADDTHRIKEIILNMSYSKNIEKKREFNGKELFQAISNTEEKKKLVPLYEA